MIVGGVVSVYALLTSPAWAEAFIIDPVYWKHAPEKEKPGSTYIRAALALFVSLGIDFYGHYGHWYFALLITITFHIMGFAILVNLKLRKPFGYLGSDKYDTFIRKIPLWIRLLVSLVLFIGSVYLFERYKY